MRKQMWYLYCGTYNGMNTEETKQYLHIVKKRKTYYKKNLEMLYIEKNIFQTFRKMILAQRNRKLENNQ